MILVDLKKKVDHLIELGSRKFGQNCQLPQKYRAQKSDKDNVLILSSKIRESKIDFGRSEKKCCEFSRQYRAQKSQKDNFLVLFSLFFQNYRIKD